MNIRHAEAVALRKIGAQPEGFSWHSWECIGTDAVKLTGCVSSGVHTSGKRKGRPLYDGPKLVAVVTDAETEHERERFIRETGNCGECYGDGKTFYSWHHIEGAKYRPCAKCNGTGRVLQEASA